MNEVEFATGILVPALGAISDLITKLVSGERSLTTASAELRNVLVMAMQRLEASDAAFAKRDAEEDERVRQLNLPTTDKP